MAGLILKDVNLVVLMVVVHKLGGVANRFAMIEVALDNVICMSLPYVSS